MGVAAIVEDGKIKNATSTTSTKEKSSTLGKDDFLQLLVAQMKFQDPLEPTSNTEYIAQYATFSEVEQIQNMSKSMDLSRASSLVGQTVQITSTDDNGKETTKMGKVDYVKYENGKAMVSVDEELYSLDDVTYVCDQDYLTAFGLAQTLVSDMAKLPKIEQVTASDKETIEKVLKQYDDMNDYQKTFLSKSVVGSLEEYRKKLAELSGKADLTKVAAVGVSAKPRPVEGSYMPCFLAGVSAATAFALAKGLPMVKLTHQQGHIAAALYATGDFTLFEREALVFHVSGGTTDLLLCDEVKHIETLGTSSDLYAGQAVDRVGVKLGFGFPAGVEVSRLAAECDVTIKPKSSVRGMECSLSGLENQYTKLLAEGKDPAYVCKYCLLCVGETLVRMANNALAECPGLPVVFSGGVMSSDLIRTYVTNRVPNAHFVPGKFASDNAIGISILAARECGAWPTTSM